MCSKAIPSHSTPVYKHGQKPRHNICHKNCANNLLLDHTFATHQRNVCIKQYQHFALWNYFTIYVWINFTLCERIAHSIWILRKHYTITSVIHICTMGKYFVQFSFFSEKVTQLPIFLHEPGSQDRAIKK